MDNYSVYYILDVRKNIPIYVGISNDVHRRFRQHFNNPQDILYQFHNAAWDELFKPIIIKQNIARSLANDIETKYILDFQQQGYKLFNVMKVNKPRLIHKPNKNSKPIYCVETNEIFRNKYEALYKYNITYTRLVNACRYGDSAGIDEQLRPLHWQFIPHNGYEEKPIKPNTIYKIEQLQDDIWVPIYIGVTTMELKYRLTSHRVNCLKNPTYNVRLADRICKCDLDYFHTHFRILPIYTNIIDRKEALELEAKTTEEYRQKYELLNINTGAHEAKEKSIKSIRLKKQFYNTQSGKLHKNKVSNNNSGYTNAGAKPCICLETQNRFMTCSAAAKFIGASRGLITEACQDVKRTAKKLHFAYLDEDYRVKHKLKWIIFLLTVDKQTYIFYEVGDRLTLQDILSWDKYSPFICDKNVNLEIIKVCNDKQELCDNMPDILNEYTEINMNKTQIKNLITQINKL